MHQSAPPTAAATLRTRLLCSRCQSDHHTASGCASMYCTATGTTSSGPMLEDRMVQSLRGGFVRCTAAEAYAPSAMPPARAAHFTSREAPRACTALAAAHGESWSVPEGSSDRWITMTLQLAPVGE